MTKVGAFNAKSKLGQLLGWVQAGEELVVTRRVKPVARPVPPADAVDPAKARQAAAAIRAMSKGVTLGGATIKDLVGEGRR